MKRKLHAMCVLVVVQLLFGGCADVPEMEDDPSGELEVRDEALVARDPRLTRPACGGFLGLACPGEGTCIDDPTDDCDPKNGGADCSGVCICRPTHTCPAGSYFDTSPGRCGCVRALCRENPCATILCKAGTQCVERKCQASCEPITLPPEPPKPPCSNVCPPGRFCPAVCLPPTD